MIHLIAHWFADPAHIGLLVSEILALVPVKYSGILDAIIGSLKK